MKQKFLAVSVVLVAPLMSFAQSNAPVTREGVRAELIQLEEAGYNPASDHTQYPRNIEAAEARLHAQDRAGAPERGPNSATIAIDQGGADYGTRAFGGMSDMTSRSGTRLAARDPFSTYSHH